MLHHLHSTSCSTQLHVQYTPRGWVTENYTTVDGQFLSLLNDVDGHGTATTWKVSDSIRLFRLIQSLNDTQHRMYGADPGPFKPLASLN